MKKIFYTLLVIIIFTSCDYYGEYSFVVENKLDNKNIQVKIFVNEFVNRNVEKDSFMIEPSFSKQILKTGSGAVGRNYDPSDIFTDRISRFDSIFVYKDSVLIDLDFLDRSYWEFEMTGNSTSTYTLKITEELVEE